MNIHCPSSNPARRVPGIAVILLVVLLAACRSADAAGTPSPSVIDSLGTSPSPASSERMRSAEPTAATSDDLGPFRCDFPVHGSASVQRATLAHVRVGAHPGYDRVVFEFADGVPAFTLKKARPPLTEDASGREIDVAGNAFWQLVMRDASRAGLDGQPMLTDTDFTPSLPKLRELVEGGDFEAVSTWYFGLEAASCVRVLTLQHPSRLVFDIEH